MVLGHQEELGCSIGRTEGFQDKWFKEPGCKTKENKTSEKGLGASCSGLQDIWVSLSPNRSQIMLFFPISCAFHRLSLAFSLPSCPITANSAFSQQKPHSCQLCSCLRQRNLECGQSDFWKYLSSSECIPRGISFSLKDLGLGFRMNQLMIHLSYFKSFIQFSRFYQLSGKVMVSYS